MAIKALLVGINNYEKAPLRGCVNDISRVSDLLSQRYRMSNDRVRLISDAAATKAAIVDGLHWLAQPDPGETAPVRLFHFSGHGIFVPDTNNDEQDGRDECLVPYDYETTGYIMDDTLRESYARFSADTHLLLLMDCCHSGGIQKDIANDIVYRYLKGSEEEEARLYAQIQDAKQRNYQQKEAFIASTMTELLQRSPRSLTEDELRQQIATVMKQFEKQHYGIEELEGNAVLIAACRSDQTAADAHFGNTYNGALTYYLSETLASAGGQMPYSKLIAGLTQGMRDRFAQEPQLECSNECMDLPFLRDPLG